MVNFSFQYPQILLLLLLVPIFILIYFLGITYTKKKAIMFGNFEALQRFSGVEFFSRNFLSLYLNIIILCLFVFAAAGTFVFYDTQTSSFSFVIAVDNSDSMNADDISPNRLSAAKSAAKKFVDLLPMGVEVAVLEFSGDAKIMQKMDSSKLKTKLAIDSIDFGDIQGTNVYNALITSKNLFDESSGLRALILISDGQLNVGETLQIIKYAERNDIIINTIAVGTLKGGVTELGTVSRVDEDILKSLAFNTEGRFFRADSLTDIDASFISLVKEVNREISVDISFHLILTGIGLFFINWILNNFKFKILP